MKKITLLILGFFLLFSACNKAGQNKSDNSQSTDKESETIVSQNGDEGCFIAYQANVCDLIDKETVAQILGVDASKMEALDVFKQLHEMGKKKNTPYKGSASATCSYKWEDKSKKIKEYIPGLGEEVEVFMNANVQITGLKLQKDVASFKQAYRSVSEDEMKKAAEQLDKKVQKDGKHTKQETGVVSDIGKALTQDFVVTYLDNLGQAAASTRTKLSGEQTDVVVFYKGNEFQVSVGMAGKTHAQNMEYTIKIAQEILKKCK